MSNPKIVISNIRRANTWAASMLAAASREGQRYGKRTGAYIREGIVVVLC